MFATTDTTGANTTADGLPTFTTTPVRVPMLGAGCRDIELRINTVIPFADTRMTRDFAEEVNARHAIIRRMVVPPGRRRVRSEAR